MKFEVKASPHGVLFSASASRLRLRFDVTSGAGTKRSVFWRIQTYLDEPDILRPGVASPAASSRQQPCLRDLAGLYAAALRPLMTAERGRGRVFRESTQEATRHPELRR